MEISNAFEEIRRLKNKFRLPPIIHQDDILPIINRAVQKAWGRPETLRRASAPLGWYPLNKNILTFPSVIATRRTDKEAATAIKVQEEQEEDVSATAVVPVALQIDLPAPLANNPAATEFANQGNAMLSNPILLESPRAIETLHGYLQDHHKVSFVPICLLGKTVRWRRLWFKP
jgi:hypothetical protein